MLDYVVCVCVCACVLAQSCLTLCDPMDYSPPGSSVHEILQVGILEWVAKISSLRDLPDPEIKLAFPELAGRLDHIVVLVLIF